MYERWQRKCKRPAAWITPTDLALRPNEQIITQLAAARHDLPDAPLRLNLLGRLLPVLGLLAQIRVSAIVTWLEAIEADH